MSFTGLSASDTLSVSCESSSREPVPSWSTTSTPSSGLMCSLLTPPPIVPDPGVPLHTPDLDDVLHPKPLPVTWALGPLWSLAVGVGVQCPHPWPTCHTGGALPPGMVGVNGSHKPGDTTQHHSSPQVSTQGSQQVTGPLGHMGRKWGQGLPPGHPSACRALSSPPGCVCSGRSCLNICPAL